MSLIITGVIDGPLTGGVPKGVELYVKENIADLSSFGIGSANNGGGSDGEEFTFPAVSANAGDYIYLASEAPNFTTFFGFAPDYITSVVNINGDDAIELYSGGSVIDLYGDINVDGNGEPWEYVDGWGARNPGAVASPVFNLSDWSFSGVNGLEGGTDNATATAPFPLASYDAAPPTPVFTINEIDADQPSTDTAEFIELYDGGLGNSSLDGLSVVLFNGNGEVEYDTISLDGETTDANGFFVIGSATVPNVDLVAFTSGGIQNGADAVALYTGTPPTTATTTNLVDALVYGSGADDVELLAALGQTVQYEETSSGTDAIARDVDGTGMFVTQAPTPGITNFIAPPVVITKISEIQGTGGTANLDQIGVDDLSPLAGTTVTISAIVTADFQDGLFGSQGDLNGFYVQEEEIDYDLSDLSSEGIFIFDGSAPLVDVNVGDLVEVTGTVSEFFGQTQLSATSVQVMATGQTVPTAVDVTFPTANIMLDDDGNYVANLEAYEGMLINVPTDMTMTEMFNLDRFGQYTVASDGRLEQFTQNNLPDVAGFDAHQQSNASRTLVLDDGSTSSNPDPIIVIDGNDGVLTASDSFRMGDSISDVSGVLGFSFDEFRLQNGTGTYHQNNPRPVMPQDVGINFKVASLNVLNYFTTLDVSGNPGSGPGPLPPRGADSVEEFTRQTEKLVTAIGEIDADVLGLVELENEFMGDQNGDGQFAIGYLVDQLNLEYGAGMYAYVDPGQAFVDTSDAISVGYIYKTATTKLAAGTTVEILDDSDLPALGLGFTNAVFDGVSTNRASLAATFEHINSTDQMTLALNHFKSKGSVNPEPGNADAGDGAGNNNAIRLQAAQALDAWLATNPTGSTDQDVLILGDLNAYAMEDPLTYLAGQGYTDLAQQFIGSSAYSFVFDGQFGTLDYALASQALLDKVTDVTEWHINSDEADAIDYNLDFGRNPALFDGTIAARNSDHDPVIVGFQLSGIPVATTGDDSLFGTEGDDAIALLTGDDFYDGKGGNDTVVGQFGDDTIFGGDGDDFINGDQDADRIFGGADNDTIEGGGAADTLQGQDGDDVIFGQSGNDRIDGGNGNDSLEGNNGDDIVSGRADNDTIDGGAGADRLYGDGEDDVILGGTGTDTLDGGDGNDSLDGGDNFDRLYGRDGDDTLITGEGDGGDIDNIGVGGAGNDLIIGGSGQERLNGETGMDTLNGGGGNDQLNSGDDDDLINGDAGDDRLIAGAGNDTLNGGTENDTLFGGDDDDLLDGGDGDDRIDGQNGSDTATGGAGADDFIWAHGAATDGDADVITDLDFAEDTLIIRSFGGNPTAYVDSVAELYGLGFTGMTVADWGGNTLITVDEGSTSHTLLLEGIGDPFSTIA